MKTLTIHQVAEILSRSTKSIRNYIKSGKLKAKKRNSKHGLEYVFQLSDVQTFAQEYLSLAIDDKTVSAASKKKARSALKKRSKQPAAGNRQLSPSFERLADKLIALEAEKRKIIEDYAEYKSQLAFKMGQMEAKLKLLDTAKAEKAKLKRKVTNLEKERTHLIKMRDFYENRPWYLFWKTYELPKSSKVKK